MPTWSQLCEDKSLRDLPYKIELNGQGQIIMSPTSNYHGNFAFRITEKLVELLSGGEGIVESAVQTSDGVKVADAAWCSAGRWEKISDDAASHIAPEICVEVLSESNTEAEMMHKRALFCAAGAVEYWLCDRAGRMRFFTAQAELARSVFCPEFPAVLPSRRR
jgi:Uma2 family endonuclease